MDPYEYTGLILVGIFVATIIIGLIIAGILALIF